ncbi:hypothetical protein SAMN04488057_10620 [Cyclobacterium lianum]|uniref:Uncharacterized protein n=2 Tax=Cyclobacterium lianum TaxID=388280 RepID=A0A1M7NRT6_9BACT|nr:hypothetical protein SAMN04488057_10620 [Cyclobacterium lianum]
MGDDFPHWTKEGFIYVYCHNAYFIVSSPHHMILINRHLPLNSERLQKLTESYRVSNDKLLKALGNEQPLSAEEGFEKTFEAFKG